MAATALPFSNVARPPGRSQWELVSGAACLGRRMELYA